MPTEIEKMRTGDWYTCLDPALTAMQDRARVAVHRHNSTPPDRRGPIGADLAALFASVAPDALIEAPFHCAYGVNIHIGPGCYMNAGCTILDTAPVRIGASVLMGPNVQIYCATHHPDAERRAAGLERASPVTIGDRVWIGGGAILLPGVTIGADAVIGAGSVVTRDVPGGARVVGNPARILPGTNPSSRPD